METNLTKQLSITVYMYIRTYVCIYDCISIWSLFCSWLKVIERENLENLGFSKNILIANILFLNNNNNNNNNSNSNKYNKIEIILYIKHFIITDIFKFNKQQLNEYVGVDVSQQRFAVGRTIPPCIRCCLN